MSIQLPSAYDQDTPKQEHNENYMYYTPYFLDGENPTLSTGWLVIIFILSYLVYYAAFYFFLYFVNVTLPFHYFIIGALSVVPILLISLCRRESVKLGTSIFLPFLMVLPLMGITFLYDVVISIMNPSLIFGAYFFYS